MASRRMGSKGSTNSINERRGNRPGRASQNPSTGSIHAAEAVHVPAEDGVQKGGAAMPKGRLEKVHTQSISFRAFLGHQQAPQQDEPRLGQAGRTQGQALLQQESPQHTPQVEQQQQRQRQQQRQQQNQQRSGLSAHNQRCPHDGVPLPSRGSDLATLSAPQCARDSEATTPAPAPAPAPAHRDVAAAAGGSVRSWPRGCAPALQCDLTQCAFLFICHAAHAERALCLAPPCVCVCAIILNHDAGVASNSHPQGPILRRQGPPPPACAPLGRQAAHSLCLGGWSHTLTCHRCRCFVLSFYTPPMHATVVLCHSPPPPSKHTIDHTCIP